MPREIACPRCGHIRSVPDDGAGPLTCPHCAAPMDEPPAGPVEKLRGKPLYSTVPVIFGFLLPVLTVSCVVGIGFVLVSPHDPRTRVWDRLFGLTCLFAVLQPLVLAQIGYWMPRRKQAPDATLQQTGQGTINVGLIVLAALAAVILLFTTCMVLVNS